MMGLSRQNQKAFASRVLALTTAPRSSGGESSGCDIFFYRPAASVSALPQWSAPARPRFAGHGEYPYRLALDGLDRDRQITAHRRLCSSRGNSPSCVPTTNFSIAAAAPSDKERIANEAINALAKAVIDQGLSLEEYDSILEVAQNDPEVREKIRQRIRPSAK
jgi:Domain of unknown function (DUF4168)